MGFRKNVKELGDKLDLLINREVVVRLLEDEIRRLRATNSQLLDRLMTRNYEEFAQVRESQEKPEEVTDSEPNYDSFIGTVGDIDKD